MRLTSLLLSSFFIACSAPRVVQRPPALPPPPTQVVKRAPPPLRVAAQLDRRFVKAGAPGAVVVRLRITTARDLAVARVPVNLALVVDTSGSMAGAAIAHARQAARAMVKALQEGDRIAIVMFHSEAEVLVPSTLIDEPSRARIVARIAARIAAIRARGTTDLAGGLSAGLAQLRGTRRAGVINRVVLLSDGNPNDARPIGRLAQLAQASAITITALGLGLDYNETLLGALARRTGGTFHFIKDPAQVAGVFRDEVIRMRQVIAQQLSLRILPGPGIGLQRVYGRAVRREGRHALVPLGVMRAGEQRDVLIRLRTPPRRAGATLELMDGLLGYVVRTPGGGYSAQHKLYLSVASTDDDAKLAASPPPGFALAQARAEAAQGTVDAIALARGARLKEALARLDQALATAREAAERFRDAKLKAQVEQMVKLRAALPSLVPRIRRTRWGRRGPHGGPRWRRRPPGPVAPAAPVPGAAATIRKAHSTATQVLDR